MSRARIFRSCTPPLCIDHRTAAHVRPPTTELPLCCRLLHQCFRARAGAVASAVGDLHAKFSYAVDAQ
eukprot:7381755-Prymnesium_polylepis.2